MVSEAYSAWQKAKLEGVDVSLIESNLRLSVEERLIQHDRALNSIEELRNAVLKHNEPTR